MPLKEAAACGTENTEVQKTCSSCCGHVRLAPKTSQSHSPTKALKSIFYSRVQN